MSTAALSPLPSLHFVKLLSHELRWQIITALARSDHRVQELISLTGQPGNLVSYHLKQLRTKQLISEHRSSADARDVYYSLDLEAMRTNYLAMGDALHPVLTDGERRIHEEHIQIVAPPVRVLFLCTQNSARSQMAEGLLRFLGKDKVEVFSAGNQPSRVHPEAIDALAGRHIDISGQRSKHFDEFSDQSFDYIITVCDRVRETCPVFPDDPEQIHWSIPDPAAVEGAAERRRAFRRTAQQLTTRIHHLLILIERKQQGR
jgi:protein-tyrosine-phosphatase